MSIHESTAPVFHVPEAVEFRAYVQRYMTDPANAQQANASTLVQTMKRKPLTWHFDSIGSE